METLENAERIMTINAISFLRSDPSLEEARLAGLSFSIPDGGEVTFFQNGKIHIAFPYSNGLQNRVLNHPENTLESELKTMDDIPAEWINTAVISIVQQLSKRNTALTVNLIDYRLKAMNQII